MLNKHRNFQPLPAIKLRETVNFVQNHVIFFEVENKKYLILWDVRINFGSLWNFSFQK